MATMLKKLINTSNSRHLLVKCTSLSTLNERPALVASLCALRLNCTAKIITQEDDKNESKPKEKVSKAMKAYLERATAHEEFMKKERADFQIGKRHLANMMGVDADTMTQEYIDKAIAYLFPSALFEKHARPIMKPPEQVFPQRKAAEFDVTGRPHHMLFYTMNANFYQLMFNAVSHLEVLDKEEDAIIRQRGQVDSSLKFDASGSEWLPKEILETKMVEKLNDSQYTQFQNVMNRVLEHPLSSKVKDFIMEHRKLLLDQNQTAEIPKPSYDSEGRAYITVKECLRKRARGEVTVRVPGTGKFSVNGQDVMYFSNIQCREQVLFPMIFTAMVDRVDVEATVAGGGPAGQAGAIRWGISMALRSLVDPAMVERMRLAGLLTRDYRRRERKKPGQKKARKKFTWKKR